MNLYEYIDASGITLELDCENKSDTLLALVDLLAKSKNIQNPDAILSLLEEREKLSTTGIGNAVAVPHCKSPEISDLVILIARSNKGVDFQALDGKPVHLFFLLIASEQAGSLHLKALAKIARLLKEEDVRRQFLELDSAEAVFNLIKSKELPSN